MSTPIPAHVRAEALRILATGATCRETAERVGVSEGTVKRWFRRSSLPPRAPGPRPGAHPRRKRVRDGDDIPLAGRWVQDGLIMRHVPEGAL